MRDACRRLSAPRRAAAAQKNLLLNGDFAKGSEDQPDLWRTEAWINNPDAFQAHWHSYSDKPSELEVDNLQANDGRWMQPLTVQPGWYQLSVDVRTENVGAKETGATISVMEDGIMSADIHGTTDWQRVTLYLKVGGHGADIDVALRVGGFGSLNTGKAFFRNATLVQIDAPAAQRDSHFRLAGDSAAGGSGADRLANLAGVHVCGAGGDRMGGLAHIRRRRLSHLQYISRRHVRALEANDEVGAPRTLARAIAPEDRSRQIETAIFLIPFITYAYFYQGSDQSIACRFDLMRSMIEKGALWINDFCGFNTADIITFHGHIYSVKAPGTSYTALIPWMIFRIALLPLSAAHEPAVLGVCHLPDDRVHDRAAGLGAVRRHVSLRAISRRVGGPRAPASR